MKLLNLKVTHKPVKEYYAELNKLDELGLKKEGAVAPQFAQLLRHCGKKFKLILSEQHEIRRKNGRKIFVDGALVSDFNLPHGYWEAKDSDDDLPKEVQKKFKAGYPKDNILFQAPNHIILYQDGEKVFDEPIDAEHKNNLIDVLALFFQYQPPEYEEWEHAVEEFKGKVPELAQGLMDLIEKERKSNKTFKKALNDFMELCRAAINPNLSTEAVEEMLIQHLLTERIFRRVFNNPDFIDRNIIAQEIEKVIHALTSKHFSRNDFLKSLDRFYIAIESTASTIDDYSQKQSFLNTVYEKFFQGFSVKTADTHGIVYTPQPIVDFMVRSVADILEKEFGRSIGDEGVHILDPFVGTGNFILRVMREMSERKPTTFKEKYKNELHCNEVMLLPYYIASMNIEHEYMDLTGKYEPFEGICLVDTFELAEQKEPSFFSSENTERVEQQRKAPIFVIIGNPPYNAFQVNENDNNKNRKYKTIDKRVSVTYARDSQATNKNALSDMYVKAFRWASDRIGDEGIVTFVSNNSYIDKLAFDGMRKNLGQDFNRLYILDLKGDIRQDSMRDGIPLGEKHTVFGLAAMVGVSIVVLVKSNTHQDHKIFYSDVDFRATRIEKFELLDKATTIKNIEWKQINPDKKYNWLTDKLAIEYESFLPLGNKKSKAGLENSIFETFSNGVKTNRDIWAYNFSASSLESNIKLTLQTYNNHVQLWKENSQHDEIDDFVEYDDTKISWSDSLKNGVLKGFKSKFSDKRIRFSHYRPYTRKHLYFDKFLNERRYLIARLFPNVKSEMENVAICVVNEPQIPFSAQITNLIPCLHYGGRQTQCFSFYTYDEEGKHRRENVTGWALEQFQSQYKDKKISKWDIFYYVYGLLHHPEYRSKYEANLKRELPRIPFVKDFWGFSKAGKKLADLHVNYEDQKEYPLKQIVNKDVKMNARVEKMKLSKDKTQLIYNDYLTLDGIPPKTFDYRLGNRSALDWIIDQYRVKTDKRSGIVNDPNQEDDEWYIVKLVGKVITVSVETVKIVNALPAFDIQD